MRRSVPTRRRGNPRRSRSVFADELDQACAVTECPLHALLVQFDSEVVELTRHAIRSWRDLAWLDADGNVGAASLDGTAQLVGVTAGKIG
jgi:hypothetical protein